MSKIFKSFKKAGLKLMAVSLSTLILTQPAKAEFATVDSQNLANLQNYTNNILAVVNTLPAYLSSLTSLAITLMAADNSASDPGGDWSAQWTNDKDWFSALSTSLLSNEDAQSTMQQNLLNSFFTANSTQPKNINDLNYMSLLGSPYVTPDPRGNNVDTATNYLLNASTLNIPLTPPAAGWRGDATAQKNYTSFYNTMTAVQTYNGYTLSRLYLDSKSKTADNTLRTQLITQSSNSDWFLAVITKDLGWVLRQILLYNSQMYVLLDQMLQTQKQMAATLAMTNSLVIVSNQLQGSILLKSAQGT